MHFIRLHDYYLSNDCNVLPFNKLINYNLY